MPNYTDTRADVWAALLPAERSTARPASYEMTPPTPAAGGTSTFRFRMPVREGPFIVTSWIQDDLAGGTGTARLLWGNDEDEHRPKQQLSIGDFPTSPAILVPFATQGAQIGAGFEAPLFVDAGDGVSLDIIDSGAGNLHFSIQLNGFHVSRATWERLRRQLGTHFLLVVNVATAQSTPSQWEVPAGWKIRVKRIRAVAATPVITAFAIELGGVHLMPLGITDADVFNMFAGSVLGGPDVEPDVELRGGERIRILYNADTAEQFLFSCVRS